MTNNTALKYSETAQMPVLYTSVGLPLIIRDVSMVQAVEEVGMRKVTDYLNPESPRVDKTCCKIYFKDGTRFYVVGGAYYVNTELNKFKDKSND